MKTIKGADITKVEGRNVEPGMVIAQGVVLRVQPHFTNRGHATHYTLEVTSASLVQVNYAEEIEVLAKVEPDLLAAFRDASGALDDEEPYVRVVAGPLGQQEAWMGGHL